MTAFYTMMDRLSIVTKGKSIHDINVTTIYCYYIVALLET